MAQADQKNATHTTHKKLYCFNQIFIIQNNYGMQLSLKMIQQTQLRVYMTSLIEDEKKNIQHHPESNIYRFGDGKLFRALQNVDIQKNNISYPLIRTPTCAYQGVRNVRFSGNFTHVLNG